MSKPSSVCVSLLAEHICVSVYVIECCLTALTKKPHAKHHRGDASPAESEFLAHTKIYGIQACTCKPSTQAISSILFWKFCCFPFFAVISLYFLSSELLLSVTYCWCSGFPAVSPPHKRTASSHWTDTAGHNPQRAWKYA